MIRTILNPQESPALEAELDRLVRLERRDPFEADAVEFVAALARKVVTGATGRAFPELAALAHWFRRARLDHMASSVGEAGSGLVRRPRGLVFVIAPANVDVLFIYGWLLSLLAGNATMCRVSQKPSDARDAFLAVVRDLADEPRFARVLSDTWLLTYAHDDALTRKLSLACDARLVWGGDATVSHIRSIPMRPVAVEAGFADRFSLAAFSASAVLDAEAHALAEMARRFANDTLWFSQQACSSPRAVFWIGEEADCERAQARFWPLFETAAEGFADEPAALMTRVTDMFFLAGQGLVRRVNGSSSALPARVAGTTLTAAVREHHNGFGLFVEYQRRALLDLIPCLNDKDQTLVCYGLPGPQIEALAAKLPNRSIDRIVLPGQATDFDFVWDGSNLFELVTRAVSLPKL